MPRHPTSRCSSLGNGGCRQNGNEEAEDYRRHSHRGGVEKGNVLPADGLKEIGSMYGEVWPQAWPSGMLARSLSRGSCLYA